MMKPPLDYSIPLVRPALRRVRIFGLLMSATAMALMAASVVIYLWLSEAYYVLQQALVWGSALIWTAAAVSTALAWFRNRRGILEIAGVLLTIAYVLIMGTLLYTFGYDTY